VAHLKKLLALFGAGAVGGTLGDQIHVQYGVLWYPRPVTWLAGQAIWVPLLFGCSTMALVYGYAPLARWAHVDDLPARRGLALSIAIFVLAYFSTAWFGDTHPIALTVALTAAWLARIVRRPTRDKLLGALACAIGGPLVEALLQRAGGFHYRYPLTSVEVPIWLPALYLHVSLLARHIYLAFIAPRPIATVQ
jgi:hypothetical protein